MQERLSEFVLALQGIASRRDRGADRVILESAA